MEKSAAIPLILILLIAASASISLNIGKAVQKMKVEVLKKGKAILTPPHRRDFLIWCFGMSLTLVAGILLMVAQKMTDKTSLVSSLNGVGLIALALFSWKVLKERVALREWSSIVLIIAGTIAISYFNVGSSNEKEFHMPALIWSSGVTAVLFVVALLIVKKAKKGYALVFAASAGVCLALMNVFYHVGPIATGDDKFLSQFSTAYPYIGFMLGNTAFVMTNLAFFHGTGIVVVPTVNSVLMILPMIYEIFIFRVTLTPPQYLGTAVIIAGVIVLTTGNKADSGSLAHEPVSKLREA